MAEERSLADLAAAEHREAARHIINALQGLRDVLPDGFARTREAIRRALAEAERDCLAGPPAEGPAAAHGELRGGGGAGPRVSVAGDG